jgi:3-polyprenyl-4-hydroxybenzoate decarboxylase
LILAFKHLELNLLLAVGLADQLLLRAAAVTLYSTEGLVVVWVVVI